MPNSEILAVQSSLPLHPYYTISYRRKLYESSCASSFLGDRKFLKGSLDNGNTAEPDNIVGATAASNNFSPNWMGTFLLQTTSNT